MRKMNHAQIANSTSQITINGATRLVGLIGWPVAHSFSPRMHNAAFAALGLNYAYVPLPVRPDRVEAALSGLAALGFVGANVTVPHKSAILPFLDDLTPSAQAIGAANTLVVRSDGSLLGDNTDGAGFLADLRAHGVEVGGTCQRALLIGAGGAARAVAYALAEAGAKVAVANRTLSKAEELCQAINRSLPGVPITAHRFPDALPDLAPTADLVVNATSLGLHPDVDPLPWNPAIPLRPEQTVYDLVYTDQTPFLTLAASAGARTISGLGMLVYQGAKAFELWTGQAAPVEVMFAAISGSIN